MRDKGIVVEDSEVVEALRVSERKRGGRGRRQVAEVRSAAPRRPDIFKDILGREDEGKKVIMRDVRCGERW